MELMRLWFADHPAATANLARLLDHLTLAAALVTVLLYLLEHARRELMSSYDDAASSAYIASLHVSVFATRALACRANGLFLHRELRRSTIVEVAQRNGDPDLHVRTMSLTTLLTKVTAAAEEAREEVEGVVLLARTAAFSVLLDAVVAVLVVDLAGLFVDEDLVGVGYRDELLRSFIVATGSVLVVVER
jgi:hypothetical protein